MNSLWLQLQNCRAFLQLNPHFLEEDRLLNEQVHHRMGMLQSSLHEVDMWEKLKNSIEYDRALGQANQILGGIWVLFDQIFKQDSFPFDDHILRQA